MANAGTSHPHCQSLSRRAAGHCPAAPEDAACSSLAPAEAWRRGREGEVEGVLGQASGSLHQPLPQAPQGRYLRTSAQGPVGKTPSENPSTTTKAEPAEPAPQTRGKMLTSAAIAPRGP